MVERRGVVVAKLLDQTSAAGCGSMVRARRPGSGMATHAQDWLAPSLSLVVLAAAGLATYGSGHLRLEAPWHMRTAALLCLRGGALLPPGWPSRGCSGALPPAQSRR